MGCRHTESDDCPICAQTLDAESADDTLVRGEAAPAPGVLPPGTSIGRYLTLERLGQGGMGVLYTAHDPQLQRLVAIKLLRSRPEKGASETAGQARLLREAQAMAQLAHPNVVPVYDSGPYEGGVFIAMELVKGATLDHWVKLKPRGWREVLELFLEAGRGLEAAHAAGLVHRDFKPSNVLVGEDGRPRVTDFGLARATRAPAPPPTEESIPEALVRSGPITLDTPLTQAGAMMGSPGYMAPEQYVGAETTEATDQFAFCVSLYEALYGERPFQGKTLVELERATRQGELPPRPRGTEVPPWVHRIVARGLRPSPADRHPSMHALLEALRADPAVARRRWALVGAGLLVLSLAGGATAYSASRQARACRGAEALLGGVWDDAVKQRSEAAFLATRAPFAREAWTLTRESLDAWSAQWVAARTEACEASRVRGEQTERQLLLRTTCLDRRLAELEALAGAFASADAALVSNAGTAVSRLSSLAACGQLKQLEDRKAPPPTLEAAARELGLTFARGRALMAAGRFAEARALLAPAVTRAQALGLPALESEGLEALGELESLQRNFQEARRFYEGAVRAAERAADDASAARVLARLISVVGWRLDKPGEARTWAALASGKLERIGGDRSIEASIAEGLGDTEWQAGRRAVSLQAYRESLSLFIAVQGEESLDVARLRSSVGWVLTEQGELSQAREELERSRALRERLLGPGHPLLVDTWNELASLATEQGDLEEALRAARLTETLTIQHGLDPLRRLRTRLGTAVILALDARPEGALEALAAARPALEALGEGPLDSWSEYHRARLRALVALGRGQEGLPEARALLVVADQRRGADHPENAALADAVAEADFAQGRFQQALEGSERYLAMKAALGGLDSPLTGRTLVRAARAQLALGRPQEALARAERAVAAMGRGAKSARWRADAAATLAEALGKAAPDVPRQRALLEAAKADAKAAGDAALLARIDALAR